MMCGRSLRPGSIHPRKHGIYGGKMKLSDYAILLINNGLMFSQWMTKDEAKRYIRMNPNFTYKAAAL